LFNYLAGGIQLVNIFPEDNKMNTIKLCREGSCCPEVKITDTEVTIGEDQNICKLTPDQWQILKEKVLSKEI
jgi:hypothetical protein